MPFQKVVKSPPSAEKIVPPSSLRSRMPTESVPSFQSRTPTNSSEPGIEPAFLELEAQRNNHCTGRGYTRWDRWFIKSLFTAISAGMAFETICAEMLRGLLFKPCR
ncbi:hypothetical protein AVEN_34839-1 [Araneus ventricosus]|uniref:Uncharacterized protein n=1 Tax=Araneus ventricosus TaxID=182803 RepID=A0A4Y2NTT6_ARAVE|nr:hypothetical protein AVEN_34839-1 [Araneus ventricosus]